MRNRDGVVKVSRKHVGEGFWEEMEAVINEGDWYHQIIIQTRQGCASVKGPLFNIASTDGESLIQELRDLKALLNAIPEI